jgi:hypothetical protein
MKLSQDRERRDPLKAFAKYFEGNPAMTVIYEDAIDRIEKEERLAEVQQIVMREWISLATARMHQLQLKSQHDMLPDEEYAELQAISDHIARVRNFI